MVVAERQGVVYRHRAVLSDMQTPIGIYQAVAGRPGAFLLESAPTRESIGRYSYIGWEPLYRLQARQGSIRLEHGGRTERRRASAFQELRELFERIRSERPSGALPPFFGGMVGYIGYDIVREFERIGTQPEDDRGLPTLHFVVPRQIVAYDHVTRLSHLIVADETGDPGEANARLDQMERLLRRGRRAPAAATGRPELLSRSMTREQYMAGVGRAKEAIAAGEVFQLVLSQRLAYRTQASPLAVYRALRSIDPSPYMFHLRLPGFAFYGSSPETLVRVDHRRVTIRPIAGTRPRPARSEDVAAMARELSADPKEQAEHLMLLDLGRNDVGRVARPGSVEVRRSFAVEEYLHVLHLVSEVEGELQEGSSSLDALVAAFPAGTLTGAPKIRAMQLIDELEPVARGPYGGAVGYISADGDLDFAIAIRAIVQVGDVAYLQSGAGIVQDSDPAREHEECQHKLHALTQALEIAGGAGA